MGEIIFKKCEYLQKLIFDLPASHANLRIAILTQNKSNLVNGLCMNHKRNLCLGHGWHIFKSCDVLLHILILKNQLCKITLLRIFFTADFCSFPSHFCAYISFFFMFKTSFQGVNKMICQSRVLIRVTRHLGHISNGRQY